MKLHFEMTLIYKAIISVNIKQVLLVMILVKYPYCKIEFSAWSNTQHLNLEEQNNLGRTNSLPKVLLVFSSLQEVL